MSDSDLQNEIRLGPGVHERAVRFPAGPRELAGNLVLPDSPACLGLVFVHGWSGVRGGPHGLLTATARDLAENGIASLRFDLGGRGESQGNGLEVGLPSMAEDLEAAVQFLRGAAEVKSIALFGMCSGGNVAIGSLPRLDGIAGLVLLSVYPFSDGDAFSRDVHRTWHFARVYWHKLHHPETWRKLVRGDIHFRQVFAVLFGHFRSRSAAHEHPSTPETTGSDTASTRQAGPPKKHLANLLCRVPCLMVYGSADPDAAAARKYYQEYAEEHELPVRFVDVPGANHNFSSRAWKAKIIRLSLEFCEKPGGAASTS